MENNTDIVKAIEEAEAIAQEQIDEYSKRILGFADGDNESRCNEWRYVQDTLQRAREALSWIPVSERLPERDGKLRSYRCTRYVHGRYVQESVYWTDGGWVQQGVIAWMENPAPYTPEES